MTTTPLRKKQPPPAEGVAQPLQVPRAALAPDPDQPRQTGVHEGLGALSDSIKARGIIQPILVRPHPDPAARAATPYMIVVGERRWAAAGRAGLDEVPVFLLDRQLSPAELLMLQIEENEGDNRQELPLYDRVRAIARAFAIEGGSQAKFALRHRKSTAWISYALSLARAEGPLGDALREGRLRNRLAARGFERLAPEDQRELLAWARQHDVAISLPATEKMAARRERRARAAAAQAASEADVATMPAPPDAAAGVALKSVPPDHAAGGAAPSAPPDDTATSPAMLPSSGSISTAAGAITTPASQPGGGAAQPATLSPSGSTGTPAARPGSAVAPSATLPSTPSIPTAPGATGTSAPRPGTAAALPATPAGEHLASGPSTKPTAIASALPAPRAIRNASGEQSAGSRQPTESGGRLSPPPTAAGAPEPDRAARLDAGTAPLPAVPAPAPVAPSATASPAAPTGTAAANRPAATDHPATTDRLPAAASPAAANRPAAPDRPAAADRPPAVNRPAAQDRPAAADRPPAVNRPAAQDRPAAANSPAARDRPAAGLAAGPAAGPASPPALSPPVALAATDPTSPDETAPGPPGAPVLRYRATAPPSSAAAPAPRLDPRPAAGSPAGGTFPPQPAAAASPVPTLAPMPPPETRSAAAGLLAAASRGAVAPPPPQHTASAPDDASGAPAAAGLVTVQLTLDQLQNLVRRLGLEPAATPGALVDQLLTFL
jgi:ParB/RepB/Spo0J family partition protein